MDNGIRSASFKQPLNGILIGISTGRSEDATEVVTKKYANSYWCFKIPVNAATHRDVKIQPAMM
jgi:hypothetical protein